MNFQVSQVSCENIYCYVSIARKSWICNAHWGEHRSFGDIRPALKKETRQIAQPVANRLVRRTVGVHAVPVDVDADLVVPRGQERWRVVGDNPLRTVPTYRRLGLCEQPPICILLTYPTRLLRNHSILHKHKLPSIWASYILVPRGNDIRLKTSFLTSKTYCKTQYPVLGFRVQGQRYSLKSIFGNLDLGSTQTSTARSGQPTAV